MFSTLRFQLFIRSEHNSDASRLTWEEIQAAIFDLNVDLGHKIDRIVVADVQLLTPEEYHFKSYQRVDIYSSIKDLRGDEVCKVCDFIAFHYDVDVEAIAF